MTRLQRMSLAAAALTVVGLPGGVGIDARAGDDPRPSAPASIDAVAVPAGGDTIHVDGVLSEEIWTRATPVTEFLQRTPSEGARPTHGTELRVAFDATALYVAVRAFDPEPDRVVGLLTRRDVESPSDWVSILIDSFHDRRTAYEFGVNAAGVKYDGYWFNDTSNDRGWDAVWDVAVARSNQGWRAEFRIPFSQLRFDPANGDALGFAAVRSVAHVNEVSTWPLLARSASGYVSSFGDLRGVTVGRAGKRVELVPYALGEITTAPVASGNPLAKSPDSNLTAGLDAKVRLLPGLTLTATVNPDFGQVEADPAVVNLSGFETFFAERRPFFVEGSGTFSFDVDCSDGQCTGLFYSRRIGRAPHRSVSAPDGGYADEPGNSTILGAAKLTGRVGAFSVGALTAVTATEHARLASGPALAVETTPVEPATSYSVARATREFSNRSRVGFMFTSTNRRLTDDLRFLPRSAVTGGVDGDWRLGGGRYSLTGYWAGSRIQGSAEAIDLLQTSTVHGFQRPDSQALTYDPTRTSLGGHAGSLGLSKISGQRTRFQMNVSYKSPGFDINDVGYLQRADDISQSNWFQIRRDTPGRFFRSVNVNFNQWAGWNFDGDRRFLGGNVNANGTFTNNWSAGGGLNGNAPAVADRLTRGGPLARTSGNHNEWVWISTDNRRRISGGLNLSSLANRHGSRTWDISPSVTWRPKSSASVTLGVDVNHSVYDAQWVENLEAADGPHYVFGRLDQHTVSLSARVNYTMTPTLSLQIYAAPFVSAGAYSNFKALTDGLALRYDDRFAGNPDFNYRSFRTTNVLRWEYRPGSTLFVVWQQGREAVAGFGDFRLGRDFGDVFGAPATNAFLVKFSRWLNF